MSSCQYYFIQSYVNGLVLDAGGDGAVPGILVKANKRNGSDGQLWCDDPNTNTIRSKLNENYCLDFNKDGKLVINPYNPGKSGQNWRRTGVKIINKPENMALQLDGNEPGSTVIKASVDPNDIPSQSWTYAFP